MQGRQEEGQAKQARSGVFLRRLASSVLLWALVLFAMFALPPLGSKLTLLIVLLILATAAIGEFYTLMQRQGLPCFPRLGLVGVLLLLASTWAYLSGVFHQQLQPAKANDFETGFLVLFVLGLSVRHLMDPPKSGGLVGISVTLFGLMYVGWLMNFLQKIAFFPRAEGMWYLLYFIAVTKFSDMGAYLVGSAIGRHKMVPRISPGKTWEGFGGALLFSTLASFGFLAFARTHLTGLNGLHALILGCGLGASAVVGDLIESTLKRSAGVKDSGSFLPGIGGILDLVDSLLFNAPLMYLYLRHILTD